VLFVSDVLEPDTRRTKVRIAFDNPDRSLKPGMFANVSFSAPMMPRLVVPTSSGVALRDAVMVGAVERFRPVVMTATVATIGMMPAANATGVGSDVQRGLATVVVGGLILATVLIPPTFYYSLEQIAMRWAPIRDAPAHSRSYRLAEEPVRILSRFCWPKTSESDSSLLHEQDIPRLED
jgi:AcrB/AcrD/AcrF family/Barrel-sandwich domain of CusB or HlyD membrane-fusion